MSTFVHFCPFHIQNLNVDKIKSGQKWTKVDKSGRWPPPPCTEYLVILFLADLELN